MDRPTENIERHIDHERELLRSNLEELEARVRAVLDWREQFRNNPVTLLSVAFGGALILGLVAGRPARPPGSVYPPEAASSEARMDARHREISFAWRTIESALIGVAAAHLRDLLAKVIPGFREQIARREGASHRHDGAAGYRS